MLRIGDLYSVWDSNTLTFAFSTTDSINGEYHLTYQVHEVSDLRNLDVNRSYRITCTVRVVIPNVVPHELKPNKEAGFKKYPLLLRLSATVAGASVPPELLGYSPRTVNTMVETSRAQSDQESSVYSQEQTVGSSTSQTNSFGVSASLGFFGDTPVGSVGADYSTSSTDQNYRSGSSGFQSERGSSAASNTAMSIKDWGAYAAINTATNGLQWTFGQEYPWNAIRDRYTHHSGSHKGQLTLPQATMNRLFDYNADPIPIAFPPSELSLFGIDFVAKASWLMPLPSAIENQSVTLQHIFEYVRGSHWVSQESEERVSMDASPASQSVTSPTLDLTLLGLDPIAHPAPENGAMIGFVPNHFVVPPANANSKFKIISGANNLQVTGSGFDSPMQTSFAQSVSLKVQFKILDDFHDYTLFMKHWMIQGAGCIISFTINEDIANPIVRSVNSQEGQGGDHNLLTLSLRNKEFSSVDYHDYLRRGLNTIDIAITPQGTGPVEYALRAIAVDQD